MAQTRDLADVTDKRADTARAAGEPDFAVLALHDDAATARELARRAELLDLSTDQLYWLEGAAHRGSEDKIAKGLGTAGALRELAGKLKAAHEQLEDVPGPRP